MIEKHFENQVVIWFCRSGAETISKKQKEGFNDTEYDHCSLFGIGGTSREASLSIAIAEISEGLKHNGWHKHYICPNHDVADHILKAISADKYVED